MLFRSLAPKIKNCNEPLNAQSIANALYGLQGMTDTTENLIFLDFLYVELVNFTTAVNKISTADILMLAQSISLCLPYLKISLDEDYMKWDIINTILSNELKNRVINAVDLSITSSLLEKRMLTAATKAAHNSNIIVSGNEHLFDLFESDIVLRIPLLHFEGEYSLDGEHSSPRENSSENENSSMNECSIVGDSNYLIINIEVDGIHHGKETNKKFSLLRDQYLRSRGVRVERMKATQQRRMSDDDLEIWILKFIATYTKELNIQMFENLKKTIDRNSKLSHRIKVSNTSKAIDIIINA